MHSLDSQTHCLTLTPLFLLALHTSQRQKRRRKHFNSRNYCRLLIFYIFHRKIYVTILKKKTPRMRLRKFLSHSFALFMKKFHWSRWNILVVMATTRNVDECNFTFGNLFKLLLSDLCEGVPFFRSRVRKRNRSIQLVRQTPNQTPHFIAEIKSKFSYQARHCCVTELKHKFA
jgi:tRNA(Ile)-lysidine synthase TilS/MesJ